MGFALSTSKFGGNSGGNITNSGAISVTIPAGAVVAVMCYGGSPGAAPGSVNGTLTDTGSNTYTAPVVIANLGPAYGEAFYCLNTGNSATSVTYTMPTVTGNWNNVQVVVFVLTVSGGTSAFPASNGYKTNHQFPSTATDNVTSGATGVAAGSNAAIVSVSQNYDTVTQTYTAGTHFTSDGTDTSNQDLMWEHWIGASASAAATYTTSDASANTITQALGFNFSASAGANPLAPMSLGGMNVQVAQ